LVANKGVLIYSERLGQRLGRGSPMHVKMLKSKKWHKIQTLYSGQRIKWIFIIFWASRIID